MKDEGRLTPAMRATSSGRALNPPGSILHPPSPILHPPSSSPLPSRPGKMHMHLGVHGVEPKLPAIVDHDSTGFVFALWQKRVAGEFPPVHEIGRDGDVRRPQPRFLRASTAMIEGVVPPVVADDLIEGDHLPVVCIGP